MRQFMVAVFVVFAALGAGAESPVDGKWAFEMNSPMGSVAAQVELKAEGTNLTGKFDLGGGRVWPVEAGKIDGNAITFTITRNRPSGESMTYEMTGTVKGDTIAGAASAMGSTVEWAMTRAK